MLWHGTAKLDHKLPQNGQDIRRSHKLYRENYEILEIGIDSRREKLSWVKNPERYLPGKFAIIITIYDNDDATQSQTQDVHRRMKT